MSEENRPDPGPPRRPETTEIVAKKIVIAWTRSRRWQSAVEHTFERRHLVWALDASDLLTEARTHQEAAILIEMPSGINDQTASSLASLLLRRRLVIPLASPETGGSNTGTLAGLLGLAEPVRETHALDHTRQMILRHIRDRQSDGQPLEAMIESSLPWSRFASDRFLV